MLFKQTVNCRQRQNPHQNPFLLLPDLFPRQPKQNQNQPQKYHSIEKTELQVGAVNIELFFRRCSPTATADHRNI